MNGSELTQFRSIFWITQILNHHLEYDYIPEVVKKDGRIIGTLIYELRVQYTGKASVKALQNRYYNGTDWVHDHLWPRTFAGENLIKTFKQLGHIDDTVLVEMLGKYCQVNYVTKAENTNLMKYQNSAEFKSPEEAYQLAGIELRDWPARTPIKKLPEIYPDLVTLKKETINTSVESEVDLK